MRSLVWAAWGAAALLLCSAVAHAQCTKDTDCKGDRVCETGKCVSPVLPPAPAAPPTAGESPPASNPGPPNPGTDAPPAPTATGPVEPVTAQLAPPPPVVWAETPPGALAPPPSDEPQFERRSRGMMIGGIIMVSIGPVALLGALSSRSSQQECDDNLEDRYPQHLVPTSESAEVERCDSYTVPMYVLGIGGALLVAAGVPMIIYGAHEVPAKKSGQAELVPWATSSSAGLRLRVDL